MNTIFGLETLRFYTLYKRYNAEMLHGYAYFLTLDPEQYHTLYTLQTVDFYYHHRDGWYHNGLCYTDAMIQYYHDELTSVILEHRIESMPIETHKSREEIWHTFSLRYATAEHTFREWISRYALTWLRRHALQTIRQSSSLAPMTSSEEVLVQGWIDLWTQRYGSLTDAYLSLQSLTHFYSS